MMSGYGAAGKYTRSPSPCVVDAGLTAERGQRRFDNDNGVLSHRTIGMGGGRLIARAVANAVVAMLVFGGCAAWGRSVSVDLRKPASPRKAARLMSAPSDDFGMLRHVNLDTGAAEVGDVDVGDELELTLFDDVRITLLLADRSPSLLGGDVFLAEASGYGGVKNAVVLRTEDGLTVDVQDYLNDRVYKVISTSTGVTVQEIEPMKGGRCGCDTHKPPNMPSVSGEVPHAAGGRANAARLLDASDEFVYVDILVAYDRNATAWANSHGGIDKFAQTAVAKMNTVLGNTGLTSYFQFRLVGVTTVDVAATDVMSAMYATRERWAGWESISRKREEVGADIVSTFVYSGSRDGMTGIAAEPVQDFSEYSYFADLAYNACEISYVNDSYVMVHECGHNMGAGHPTAVNPSLIDVGPGLYEYSAGYYFTGNNGLKYGTVMAYPHDGYGNSYTIAPFFSSPHYAYHGTAVGDENHDNTLSLYNTYRKVARFGDAFIFSISDNGYLTKYKGSGGNVTIPAGVTDIGSDAFREGGGVWSVTIPDGVKYIAPDAFDGCSDLERFVVAEDNPIYSAREGILCDKGGTEVIACPGGLTKITIPDGVTDIGSNAFGGCDRLESVVLPVSLASVSFLGCSVLTSITFKGNAPIVWEHAFDDVIPSCTVYVPRGSTGWGVTIPGTWCGVKIAYSPGSVVLRAIESSVAGQIMRIVLGRDCGIDGRIAVKVKTQTSTGICGTDFAYVKDVLVWEDGDMSDKVIEIPTYASGAGKTLRVKLATLTTGAYSDCVKPTLDETKVYADILRPSPGTIVATAPIPLSVVAGDVLRMTFSRTGGSDGSIAVKAKTQTSTALMGVNGTADFDYVKQVLEWTAGDDSDRYLDIPTYVQPWEGTKRLRVKLSTLATGAYAGNLVPKLEVAKIYVELENPSRFGTVSVEPELAAPVAGEPLRLVFRRKGGSGWPIAVKYKVQTSTAIAGQDFEYMKGVVTWGDGEDYDQEIEVPTYPSAAGKQLRVKLSTLTQGDYVGCVTPYVKNAKVYVPLW